LLQRQAALEQHLSNVAHDLKTPLTSLFMAIEALDADADDPDAVRSRVSGALEDALYLASLTENLHLDTRFSQSLDHADETLGSGIELGALIDRVVRRYRRVSSHRSTTIELIRPDKSLHCRGNETLLEQAVSNVVQNAVLHAGDGATITIQLIGHSDGFELSVADDGPGVPPNELDRLATRHYRGDSARTRAPFGTGLGLNITRHVCDLHGFGLRFENQRPSGLRVTITGPAGSESAAAPSAGQST